MKIDFLKPTPQLLIKLGSAIVHADEFLSDKGHELDLHTFKQLLNDEDVKEWISQGTKQAFLPVKR
jgi:hypothetical protein